MKWVSIYPYLMLGDRQYSFILFLWLCLDDDDEEFSETVLKQQDKTK